MSTFVAAIDCFALEVTSLQFAKAAWTALFADRSDVGLDLVEFLGVSDPRHRVLESS